MVRAVHDVVLDAGGTHHPVAVARAHDGATTMQLGDTRHALQAVPLGGERFELTLDGRRQVLSVYAVGERVTVFGAEGSASVGEYDPVAHAGDHAGEAGRLTAPMPGKVVALLAKAGDAVKKGQALAVMEAMKMEHTIHAPRDGVVSELLYGVGDQVAEGGELLRLAAA